jgi:hypothetical protein
MGIQDRDYYREWKREQARPKTSQLFRRTGLAFGLRPWIVWSVLIVVGVVVVKLLLEVKRSLPFPQTGAVHWYVGRAEGPMAPLTLKAPAMSKQNFVVKFDTWEGKQPVAMIPVRGGESAVLQMPLGVYRMTIIKGSAWQGPDRLFSFMPDARESVHPVTFHRVGNTFTGHVIQLQTLTGNMETRPSPLGY